MILYTCSLEAPRHISSAWRSHRAAAVAAIEEIEAVVSGVEEEDLEVGVAGIEEEEVRSGALYIATVYSSNSVA